MNSAPSQPGNTFNSQPAGTSNPFAQPAGTQNNPFTQDLKGEFTSNFGTNTNAVSQIFKDGSYGGDGRSKMFIFGAIFLVLAAFGWWMLSDSSSVDEVAESDVAADEETKAEEKPAEETAAAPAVEEAAAPAPEAAVAPEPMATGAVQLMSPENGATLAYDETQGSASFTWGGGPGTIVFSRHSSMQPEVMRVKVSSGSYSFHRPWPGQWYWKVESEAGASEVRSFSVSAPIRRNVALTAPQSGATIAGTGGAVTWTGDKGVAYYRVEMVQGDDWSNPQFKFSSSGSQVQLNGVPAGSYNMRLGAFSEVSGRWEYTAPVAVTVQ